MADGDVVLDRNFEFDAEEGTRIELFAVEDATEPGGYTTGFSTIRQLMAKNCSGTIMPTIPMLTPITVTKAKP